MRRKKLFTTLAPITAVALLTSGCLNDGGSAQTGSGSGNTSTTVEIMTGMGGGLLQAVKASLDPYAKEQGITIKWSPSDNFNQLIVTRVQGNNLPDIALFPQPGIMKDLAAKGKLAPLDDILDMPTLKNSMTPGALEVGTQDGKLYGLMMSMNVKSLVFYPKQAFESAGYEAPKSIPELLALTDKIRSEGKTPWCLGIESGPATGWPATDWMEELVLKYGGRAKYDDWVTHKIKFDSPLVRQAAGTFEKIAFTEGNVLGGRKSISSNNFGTAGNPMFRTPPGCYLFKQGNFVAEKGIFPDDVVADIDNRVGVFGFPPATPDGENSIEGGGDLAGLFSKDNAAAKKLLQYMSTKDFGTAGAKMGSWMSPHKDFDVANYPTNTIRDIAKIAYGSTSLAFDGSDAMPGAVGSGSFWKGMTGWISGQQSLDQALKTIDGSWPAS
ncbi:alpha-glucoside transport system substrate-binding protein [Nonomuraea polychroma]|uniref:Alpha-glucoside transport system substrate-binding protein n=1 Tax=Nonomuraea polychroma TaxID=46176 RepID=A0A438MC99_9ACTN|nr:ABC transporter substrate-binding protein [Nonomuraea polychroma]RVX43307.1 alpha-glucoside transport system substrate-binding protein [Nonomuraea polychroma]